MAPISSSIRTRIRLVREWGRVVPITAKDKAGVERKAAKAGKISTAEFVRRAALNYEPADEEAAAELRSLAAGFDELHASTLGQLDRANATLARGGARRQPKLIERPGKRPGEEG